MVKNYKVITLCGSTKFKDEFLRLLQHLIPFITTLYRVYNYYITLIHIF